MELLGACCMIMCAFILICILSNLVCMMEGPGRVMDG